MNMVNITSWTEAIQLIWNGVLYTLAGILQGDSIADRLLMVIGVMVLMAFVANLFHSDDPHRTADGPTLRESERNL